MRVPGVGEHVGRMLLAESEKWRQRFFYDFVRIFPSKLKSPLSRREKPRLSGETWCESRNFCSGVSGFGRRRLSSRWEIVAWGRGVFRCHPSSVEAAAPVASSEFSRRHACRYSSPLPADPSAFNYRLSAFAKATADRSAFPAIMVSALVLVGAGPTAQTSASASLWAFR